MGLIHKSVTNPQQGDLHVNGLLTNFSQGWWNAKRAKTIASLGICPVRKQSDLYLTWSRDDILRLKTEPRAIGANSNLIGVNVDTSGTYFAITKSIGWPIEDGQRDNADDIFELDNSAMMSLTEAAVRTEEVDAAAVVMANGYDTNNTSVTKWDLPNSSPIEDMATARDTILKNTGVEANVLMLGHQVRTALLNNAEILDRLGLGGNPAEPRMVTDQALASLFGVDRVVESTVVQNTANPGATFSADFVVGKHAVLAYVPDANVRGVPSAFKKFMWTGMNGSQDGRRILRYRIPPRTDMLEIEHAYAYKITSPCLGYRFQSVVS